MGHRGLKRRSLAPRASLRGTFQRNRNPARTAGFENGRFQIQRVAMTRHIARPAFFSFCAVHKSTMPFEKLNGAFMVLRRFKRAERSQIPAFARLRILFTRIQTIFAGMKFSDHGNGFRTQCEVPRARRQNCQCAAASRNARPQKSPNAA